MRKRRKALSKTTKNEIIRQVAEKVPAATIAKSLKISKASVFRHGKQNKALSKPAKQYLILTNKKERFTLDYKEAVTKLVQLSLDNVEVELFIPLDFRD